jgi:hypothetical protein
MYGAVAAILFFLWSDTITLQTAQTSFIIGLALSAVFGLTSLWIYRDTLQHGRFVWSKSFFRDYITYALW